MKVMKYFVFASLLCLCACSDDNDNKNNEIPQDLVEFTGLNTKCGMNEM